MRIQSRKNKRISYSIHDIINSTEKKYLEHILCCHTFIGCNTTSQILNYGKRSIFSKIIISNDLQHLSKKFYQNGASVNEIGNASIRVFELLHSALSNLQQIRTQKYDTMVVSNRSNIDPVLLPPSPRAAFYSWLTGSPSNYCLDGFERCRQRTIALGMED